MAHLSYRNNERNAFLAGLALKIFLGFWTLIYVPIAALDYWSDYTDWSVETADKLYTVHAILFLLTLLLGLLTAAAYVNWFYRLYRNLELLGREMAFHRAWAIVAWFTPFISLGQPWRMMEEAVDSYDLIRSKFPAHWTRQLIPRVRLWRLIMIWWVSYTAFWVQQYFEVMHLEDRAYPKLYTFGLLLYIFAGVMAIVVLKHVHALESEVAHIWESGEFQARVEEISLAKAQKKMAANRQQKGSNWYQKPGTPQPKQPDDDPFQ